MNIRVRVIQVSKYGINLTRKPITGLKKSRIGALDKKSGNVVLTKSVILLERIINTGTMSIIVR
jgi:hypothetical protein